MNNIRHNIIITQYTHSRYCPFESWSQLFLDCIIIIERILWHPIGDDGLPRSNARSSSSASSRTEPIEMHTTTTTTVRPSRALLPRSYLLTKRYEHLKTCAAPILNYTVFIPFDPIQRLVKSFFIIIIIVIVWRRAIRIIIITWQGLVYARLRDCETRKIVYWRGEFNDDDDEDVYCAYLRASD